MYHGPFAFSKEKTKRYEETKSAITDNIKARLDRYYILEDDHRVRIYGIQIIELSDIFGTIYSTTYKLVNRDEILQFKHKHHVYIVVDSLREYLSAHHMWDKYHMLTDKVRDVNLSVQDFMDTYWN